MSGIWGGRLCLSCTYCIPTGFYSIALCIRAQEEIKVSLQNDPTSPEASGSMQFQVKVYGRMRTLLSGQDPSFLFSPALRPSVPDLFSEDGFIAGTWNTSQTSISLKKPLMAVGHPTTDEDSPRVPQSRVVHSCSVSQSCPLLILFARSSICLPFRIFSSFQLNFVGSSTKISNFYSLCEFQASFVYIESSRSAMAISRVHVLTHKHTHTQTRMCLFGEEKLISALASLLPLAKWQYRVSHPVPAAVLGEAGNQYQTHDGKCSIRNPLWLGSSFIPFLAWLQKKT